MDLTRPRSRGLGRYQNSLGPAYRTLCGPSGRGRQRCVARQAIRQGRIYWSWTLKTQRSPKRGAQRDRDPGGNDRPDSGRPAIPTPPGWPEGAATEYLDRADAEAGVRGRLRLRRADERDPPRPLPRRAGSGYRHYEDPDQLG